MNGVWLNSGIAAAAFMLLQQPAHAVDSTERLPKAHLAVSFHPSRHASPMVSTAMERRENIGTGKVKHPLKQELACLRRERPV